MQLPLDPNVNDADGMTPIVRAAANGRVPVARLLLEAGADTDLACEEGVTPLLMASVGGHVEAVRLLLEAGTDTDFSDNNGITALMGASAQGHVEAVRLLLEAGTQKDMASINGRTALMWASERGHADIVRLLLDAGCDKDLGSNTGMTALTLAAARDRVGSVRLLLQAGADTNLADNSGTRALMWAAAQGHDEATQAFSLIRCFFVFTMSNKKDVWFRAKFTPCTFTCRFDRGRLATFWWCRDAGTAKEVVQLLLEAGADKDLATKDGMTAWALAASHGRADTLRLLEQDVVKRSLPTRPIPTLRTR